MQKIMLKALELAGYKDANTLATILSYVPNPQVATEMLLGVHVPKTVDSNNEFRKHKYIGRKEIVQVIGYDELGDTVKYLNHLPKQRQAYFATQEDKKANIYSFDKPKQYFDWEYVDVPGITVSELSMSIAEFEETYSQILPGDQATEIICSWKEEIPDQVSTL